MAGDAYGAERPFAVSLFNENVVPDLEYPPASDTPTVVLLAGQPGAGKSSARNDIVRDVFGIDDVATVAPLDMDDLRVYHPQLKDLMLSDDHTAGDKTQVVAGLLMELAIEHVVNLRCNATVDSTFRNTWALQMLTPFKLAGYRTCVAFIAVHQGMSHLSALDRYFEQRRRTGSGRYISKEYHDNAYAGLLSTIDQLCTNTQYEHLVDDVLVYGRGDAVASRRESMPSGGWNQLGLRKMVESERTQHWNASTLASFMSTYKAVSTHLLTMESRYAAGHDEAAEIVTNLVATEACIPTCALAHGTRGE